MAVLQGARLRTDTLPPSQLDRRRSRASTPATIAPAARMRPMGLLMAAIVAATMLGLVYLTQTLGSNATTSEIYLLERSKAKIQTSISRDAIGVLQATDGDAVRTEARRLKLTKLGEPIVLSAP